MSKLRMVAVGLILLMVIISYVVPYILAVLIGFVVIISWWKGRQTARIPYSEYQEYIHSPVWYATRQKIFERDRYICQHCHTAVTLQNGHCHHLTYDRLGNEDWCDLITLCRKCHEKVHS